MYPILKKRYLMKNVIVCTSLLFFASIFTACSSDSGSDLIPLENNTTTQSNEAPSIDTAFLDISLEENNGTTNYELNVSDIDGDSLTLSVESNDTSILTVTPNWTNPLTQGNYNGVTLDFNLTTVADSYGLVNIEIILSDGDINDTKSFDVNVTKAIFKSGDSWKGLVYETVTSPFTGKIWLDRNLGASQVCTAYNDTACYGDYYQWGRDADGHEKSTSDTNTNIASTLNPGHGDFILDDDDDSDDGAAYDWLSEDDNGSFRSAKWSKTDGSSVCPVGYRVPTIAELEAETTSASTPVTNSNDAFANFLKLPSAGYRISSSGFMDFQGSFGYVWSSSVDGSNSGYIYFHSAGASSYFYYRANGRSVRCLSD